MTDLTDLSVILGDPEPRKVNPDLCKCSECGDTYTLEMCHKDFGYHNGLESPPYEEIHCPYCVGGGYVDEFSYSKEQWSKYMKFEAGIVTDDWANK